MFLLLSFRIVTQFGRFCRTIPARMSRTSCNKISKNLSERLYLSILYRYIPTTSQKKTTKYIVCCM